MVSDTHCPDSGSPDLTLCQPTTEECITVWTNISSAWKDFLSVPMYIEQSKFLTTAPLAKGGGMTMWILVEKNLPQNQRPIYCSCETIAKRALTSDSNGNIEDNIVHGVASVFCPERYRRRGYAARLLRDLSRILKDWQPEKGKCAGSILYSDIGEVYYAKLGWLPHSSNSSLNFPAIPISPPISARRLVEADLAEVCKRDEALVRKSMRTSTEVPRRVTILPDLDNMLFHISKEHFATKQLFGTMPQANGAIAGSPGKQVWAIWCHRYYGHPDWPTHDNVLYILRLVIEDEESAAQRSNDTRTTKENQTDSLKAVILAAQAEAAAWRLDHVRLWDPNPLIRNMLSDTGIAHELVERKVNIASGLWYDTADAASGPPVWETSGFYPFV